MPSANSLFTSGFFLSPALLFIPLAASAQGVINFGDLSLSPESHYNGSDQAGGFVSGGAAFNNHYDGGFWGGWSYSNVTDTETAGWTNQYAAITGAGVEPSGIYGVAYMDTFTPAIPRIVLPEGEIASGVRVTNTTYAYYAMRDGDDFAKKFGGEGGDDPDFFRLTVTGLTATENSTGSVDFYLADYRFEDNSLDYLLDAWSWVDLRGLGSDTRILEFTLESSDASIWGINTPAYFALGEITMIPEPGILGLWAGLGAGLAAFWLRGRKRKNREADSCEAT